MGRGDITGRAPSTLSSVCGGTQWFTSLLQNQTPNHSREGSLGGIASGLGKRLWILRRKLHNSKLSKSQLGSQLPLAQAWFLPLPRELEYCLLENRWSGSGGPGWGRGSYCSGGAGEGVHGWKSLRSKTGSGWKRGTDRTVRLENVQGEPRVCVGAGARVDVGGKTWYANEMQSSI